MNYVIDVSMVKKGCFTKKFPVPISQNFDNFNGIPVSRFPNKILQQKLFPIPVCAEKIYRRNSLFLYTHP